MWFPFYGHCLLSFMKRVSFCGDLELNIPYEMIQMSVQRASNQFNDVQVYIYTFKTPRYMQSQCDTFSKWRNIYFISLKMIQQTATENEVGNRCAFPSIAKKIHISCEIHSLSHTLSICLSFHRNLFVSSFYLNGDCLWNWRFSLQSYLKVAMCIDLYKYILWWIVCCWAA